MSECQCFMARADDRFEITAPGPISARVHEHAGEHGFAMERWTPQVAVFVRGNWTEVVLKPSIERWKTYGVPQL